MSTYKTRFDPLPLEKTEEIMLDDFEASSRRLKGLAKVLDEEANVHNRLLVGVERDMDNTTSLFHKEAIHAENARRKRGGICWMYLIIALELTLLVFLLYFGLS